MDQAFLQFHAVADSGVLTGSMQANMTPLLCSVERMPKESVHVQDLAAQLATITGFDAVSLQPNSGASGEYAGLMSIRAYHLSRGDHDRK